MAITQSRPEKQTDLIRLVGGIRNEVARAAREDGLNISEALLGMAGAFAAVLAGAYKTDKDRETVIEAVPHVIRAHLAQWDQTYANLARRASEQ